MEVVMGSGTVKGAGVVGADNNEDPSGKGTIAMDLWVKN